MYNRRSTPKVRDGRVQKKNRHAPTRLNSLSVGLSRPASGFRQVTSKQDIWKFLRLIPDWKRVSSDLDMIYLCCRGDVDYDGYYGFPQHPEIVLAPWANDLKIRTSGDHFRQHEAIFRQLGAAIVQVKGGFECRFTEESARAYQLLHIFLHELGHHHYRITAGRGKSGGSEKYAEDYALRRHHNLWRDYCHAFKFDPAQERKTLVD